MKSPENAVSFIIYHAFIISRTSCPSKTYKQMINKTPKLKISCRATCSMSHGRTANDDSPVAHSNVNFKESKLSNE